MYISVNINIYTYIYICIYIYIYTYHLLYAPSIHLRTPSIRLRIPSIFLQVHGSFQNQSNSGHLSLHLRTPSIHLRTPFIHLQVHKLSLSKAIRLGRHLFVFQAQRFGGTHTFYSAVCAGRGFVSQVLRYDI